MKKTKSVTKITAIVLGVMLIAGLAMLPLWGRFAPTYKNIENGVVSGYQAIEDGAVSGYGAVENFFVGGYKKIEGKFVDTFLSPNADVAQSGDSNGE